MTAIVLNTATAAVTESTWAFKSITGSHAADDAGLYTLGGDTDNGAAISAELRGGKFGGETLQNVGNVYLALVGDGSGTLIVQGLANEWEYPVDARPTGVSRAVPGRGIRESFLAFGYRNANGADFHLNRIDAEVSASPNRRK